MGYSGHVANRFTIVLLLTVLVIATSAGDTVFHGPSSRTASASIAWTGFLYGIPAVLAVLILACQRWASMACVMYATIGLALDISTVVQEITGPASHRGGLILSGITGPVNFLLIVLGGWTFMQGGPGTKLPTSRPPNPLHPSASESDEPARSRQP